MVTMHHGWNSLTFVCAYNIKYHIDEETAKPIDVEKTTWDRLNALVKYWIYNTISPELAHTIMKPGASTLDLYKHLQENFHNNRTTRVVYLEEQSNNTSLSSFSNFIDYYARLKNLADQLENVGHHIS